MPTHIGRGQAEAAHRVLGVENFSACHAPAQKWLGSLATIKDVGFEPWLGGVASNSQVHAETTCPAHQKRKIESEDVVVLERVGIPLSHDLDEASQELGFGERRRIEA